ncbi:MAG: hypothetical protein WDN28_07965 [Chthoniobacter sp.]
MPQAETLARQIRETIAEVRALSHGLAPVSLADDGLMHALHELAEATARSARLRCILRLPRSRCKCPTSCWPATFTAWRRRR